MSLERARIALQAAGVALVAIGLLGGASYWAIEKLVAAELAPIAGKVEALEDAGMRTAKAAEKTAQGIARLQRQVGELDAKQTEALEWIKKALQRLEAKAHSH